MTTLPSCLSCGSGSVQNLLDFGAQPPSNRFVRAATVDEEAYQLVLGQCATCGLLQLINPMPAEMVKSRFEWLTYNEPEGHLDSLVERLTRLEGVSRSSAIVGLTYKDDSTLARFYRLGYANTFRYDLKADFGIDDPYAGLETIQEVVSDETAARLVRVHGQADLVIARHVLEHAHDPGRFLRALGRLVKPGGYCVFEMPDCAKFIGACDYSFVWEEHICYFSPQTLVAFARRN
ncbi:MAG: class I SAM-dependent methyltransferase, partial [Methyloceanibacter sp.]